LVEKPLLVISATAMDGLKLLLQVFSTLTITTHSLLWQLQLQAVISP
jgi:hypothetical protein